MVAGDVNMPHIDWGDNFSSVPDGHYSHSFIEGIQECGFFQHVTRPTRYREGMSPSTLDIILSNEEGLMKLAYLLPIGNSDHIVLHFDLTFYAAITERVSSRLN